MSEYDRHVRWIEAIQMKGKGLTKKEVGFIEDTDSRLSRGYRLTFKQESELKRIFIERVNG